MMLFLTRHDYVFLSSPVLMVFMLMILLMIYDSDSASCYDCACTSDCSSDSAHDSDFD